MLLFGGCGFLDRGDVEDRNGEGVAGKYGEHDDDTHDDVVARVGLVAHIVFVNVNRLSVARVSSSCFEEEFK